MENPAIIVTYFRSSSYNAWDWCQHRYFLEYTLGIKPPANEKADKGSVVHKALEVLAHAKLAVQECRASFVEPESGRQFTVNEAFDESVVLRFAFDHYAARTAHGWGLRERSECQEWLDVALSYNNGQLDPRRRHILKPEQYFDITFDEPWATYSHRLPDGNLLEGQLAIRGTVDLVTGLRPGVIEYLDWKTGRRWDWAKDKEKTQESMEHDPQLLMYHYALSHLYPEAELIVMTIVFIRDGGPFSYCWGKEKLSECKEMLRKRFEVMRGTTVPSMTKTWKCTKLCDHGKKTFPGTPKTVCQHLHDELVQLGMDKVVAKYGKDGAFNSYGEGGGRCH